MKTNKTFLLAAVFSVSMILLSGCSKDEHGLWVQRQVAKKEQQKQWRERTPAQNTPQCFNDRFQDAFISQEVQKLESEYAGGKRGSFQHGDMKFDDLPQATIDALSNKYLLDMKTTGASSWTAVDSKQKDCKSYDCFVSALYENPTNEGLLHYWFFLKTGYPIAAFKGYPYFDNVSAPTVIVPGLSLESYLFTKDEWKALWLVTQMLPPSMLHMPSVSSIHRTPHGNTPQEWKEKGTCGWAFGTWSSGEILLSDGCLTLNSKNVFNRGQYFYQSTTHELAHRFSAYNYAKPSDRTGPKIEADEEADFLALSGWRLERLAKPDGTYEQKWKAEKEGAGWVTDYSRTSPAEDFAEDVGTFRSIPDELYSYAPDKYNYIKNKVFGGQGYSSDDLNKRYAEMVHDGVVESLDQWLTPCLNPQEIPAATTSYAKKLVALAKKIEIKLPIDAKVKACIQRQVVSAIFTQFDQIRYNEPEGCDVLNVTGADVSFAATSLSTLGPDLNEYFKTHEKLTDLMKGVGDFRQALLQEFDGRALVVQCAQESDPKVCYDAKLAAEFDRLFQKYKVLLSKSVGDITEIERARFLASNSYPRVYQDVTQFYESFFAKFNDEIQSRTDQLWQTCLAVPARANTDVLLEPYSAGNQYVAPAVIQCLNEHLPDELTALRSKAGEDQKIDTFSPGAKTWINQRILLPRFKTLLDVKVAEGTKAETSTLESLKPASLDEVAQDLIQDQSWRKNASYSYAECKAEAIPNMQRSLKAETYRFIAVDPVVEDLANQACEKYRLWFIALPSPTPTVNAPVVPNTPSVPTASQKQELEPVWKQLQPLMVAEASTRFDRCRGRVYFAQRLKRYCLFTESTLDDQDQARKTAWNWTKERAIRKWMATEEVKTFFKTKSYTDAQWFEIANARAEDDRQEFVDAILDQFYGGNSNE